MINVATSAGVLLQYTWSANRLCETDGEDSFLRKVFPWSFAHTEYTYVALICSHMFFYGNGKLVNLDKQKHMIGSKILIQCTKSFTVYMHIKYMCNIYFSVKVIISYDVSLVSFMAIFIMHLCAACVSGINWIHIREFWSC